MIAQKIAERIGRPDLIDVLANELTSSELTSLLLDVFDRKAQQLSPAELLRAYQSNRFVKPADIDVVGLHALESQIFTVFNQFDFSPVELSPVAPLGSCSVISTTGQKKVLSATRQTEVVADATNALALHVADARLTKRKSAHLAPEKLRFSTIHRHLRTPTLPDIPGMRSHFKIACFVLAGRDSGSHRFEKEALAEHVAMMTALFRDTLHIDKLTFRCYPRKGYADPVAFVTKLVDYVREQQADVRIEIPENVVGDNNYYKGLQCKIVIEHNGQSIDIGDGGFVDWTQQLLQNRKERLFTAGIGIEMLYRLLQS
ncbi:hypothetical protein [Spirosoma endbachense]|uniref:Uncharacterized protein n=1 Tax=Spirosoma endbachense TaxID=2666025 RepID=A0A6P1W6L7_9BACT|nr:hypothetical protein [Spirosoma endbachense]QHW00003.1 hypothetical protein GJR95_35520 [Spirosoma endbachense]